MGHRPPVTGVADPIRARGRCRRGLRAAAGLVAVVTVTSGTTAAANPAGATPATASLPCGIAAAPISRYQHVIWIWMENHQTAQVIGRGDAAYTTGLARRCGRAARYASVGSPSLPNYLGATSGATHGVSDDASPVDHRLAVANLFRLVRTAGLTERSYEESMRSACQLTSEGEYAVKHNPALYYVGPGDRAACAHDDVPLGATTGGALRRDLDRGTLPAFSFITPNLCSDTHDCPVRVGDRWLAQWIPRIVRSGAYQAGSLAVFVVWDEPTPMPLVVVSPRVRPGTVARAPLDHYALLRTTEELLGLSPLLGHAAGASSMRPAFGL
jgi:hypothetical protein